jgi:hypothetical protein
VWPFLVLAALVVAGGGVAAFLLLQDDAKYPDEWDARVLPLAEFVQRERGLLFDHPVYVDFLDEAAWKEEAGIDADLTDEERQQLEHGEGMFRAFGLAEGDLDLLSDVDTLGTSGTVGQYRFEDERISVRGDALTANVKSTLVHELTHVLQDQHFDIGDRMKKLSKDSDYTETSEESVLDAIVEGDASRVETRYRSSLTPKQRRTLDVASKDESAEAMARIKKVPKVVISMVTSPYTLGEGLVTTVAEEGGNKAVDKLFRHPPKHESSLLDPFEVITGNTDAEKVEVPELEDGEKKFDSGEFGVLTWYLMLAERLPLQDALKAVDGWGGDAYVGFERGDATCARLAYVGDTAQDTTRMLSALQRWTADSPGSTAHVTRDGKQVRLESCDPGTTAHGGKDASENAILLVAVRSSIGIGLLAGGMQKSVAGCLAGKLSEEYPVSKLTDPKFGANDPAVTARVQQLAAGCREA